MSEEEQIIGHNQSKAVLDAIKFENGSAGLSKSLMLVEVISIPQFLFIFSVFLIFESVFIFSSTKVPQTVNTTSLYYPLTQEYTLTKFNEATVKIILEPLSSYHSFIQMSGEVLRYASTQPSFTNNLIVDGKIEQLSDHRFLGASAIQAKNFSINYFNGVSESSKFLIFKQKINDKVDCFNISLTLKTDYHNVRGFLFYYSFSAPNLAKFINSAKFLLSGSAFYATVCFLVFYFKGQCTSCISSIKKMAIRQKFSLLLGILGIFATFPIFSNLETLFSIVFLNMFRFFVFYVVDTLIQNSSCNDNNNNNNDDNNSIDRENETHFEREMKPKWTKLYFTFVVIYGIIELAVNLKFMGEFNTEIHSFPLLDKILFVFHIFYCLSVVILIASEYLVSSKRKSDDVYHLQTCVYSLLFLATIVVTLVTKVFLVFLERAHNYAVDVLVCLSCHVLISIALLLLHHAPGIVSPRRPAGKDAAASGDVLDINVVAEEEEEIGDKDFKDLNDGTNDKE